MKISIKGVVSICLCLILAVSTFSGMTLPKATPQVNAVTTNMVETADNEYGLMDTIENSLILHCWCWSFNTIKNNMRKIAEAGYSAVQTSPITRCNGSGTHMDGNWYQHYQPTAYTIGNYQLGTESEFRAMCNEAHKYGVKVIVDVVANHTSTDRNSVEDSLKNISGGAFHNNGSGIDYNDRKSVTQRDLIGLPDLNTQNPNVQNHILSFLKKAVAAGADGFRYDAAKHIELPDDDSSYAGNFWPTVLDNGSSFQYGETLEPETTTTRAADYAKLMHITASSYGYILREQIALKQITATKMADYSVKGMNNTESDRFVTWVESHDNYIDQSTYRSINNTQIRLCWAIAVAQGDTTSLFFDRPKGSSSNSVFGSHRIGDEGDSNYYHSEVVAVNKFHNAMNGQIKELKNLGSKAVLMISRGSSGVVIVNSDTNDVNIETETSLKDGAYTDYAHGTTFTVSGGVLKGKVGKEQIAVIYTDNIVRDPFVSASYEGDGTFYDTVDVTLKANYATQSYYQINGGVKTPYISGTKLTLGSDLYVGENVTLTLSATGEEGTTSALKTYTFTKTSKPALQGTTIVYYDNSLSKWDTVCVYAYRDNGNATNAQWPGQPMKDLGDDIWGYVLDESWSDAYIIFNNNNNGKQDPDGQGYTIRKGESKILSNGSWQAYTPPVTQPATRPSTAPTTIPTTAPTTPPVTIPSTVPTTNPITEPTTAPSFTIPTIPVTDPTTAPSTAETTKPSKQFGDVNVDGKINIMDVTLIQKYLVEMATLTPQGEILAKVRGFDNINIKDATCIQKYIVGLGDIGRTGMPGPEV